jgi:hypothetical protein
LVTLFRLPLLQLLLQCRGGSATAAAAAAAAELRQSEMRLLLAPGWLEKQEDHHRAAVWHFLNYCFHDSLEAVRSGVVRFKTTRWPSAMYTDCKSR